MKRPLVWAGIAYISGEVMRYFGLPMAVGILLSFIFVYLMGRYIKVLKKNRLLYILPIFCLCGWINMGNAMAYPQADIYFEDSVDIHFHGIISQTALKTNSYAIEIPKAEVTFTSPVTGEEYRENGIHLLIYADQELEGKIALGDEISGSGSMQKIEAATNPGQFDQRSYYHARGIDYTVYADSVEQLSVLTSWQVYMYRLRAALTDVYETVLDTSDAGVIDAMILGDKGQLSDDLKSMYQDAGISHILAISGLHISILGMGLFDVLKAVGLGLYPSAFLSGFVVISYGIMIGAGSSSLRALIMYIVRMGAVFVGRSYDMLSALALSALILFWMQPLMITQSGVQFSYMAILFLGAFWKVVEEAFVQKTGYKDNRKQKHLRKNEADANHYGLIRRLKDLRIRDVACSLFLKVGPAVCVTLGTLPLTAYYYGQLPVWSMLVNMIVLPLMSILVPAAMLVGGLGLFSMKAARIGGIFVHLMLLINNTLVSLVDRLPGSVIRTGGTPVIVVIIYYLILGLICGLLYFGGRDLRKVSRLFLICLILLIPFRKFNAMVTFLDVGQGDCIFVRSPSGRTYMIDGGSTTVSNAGKYRAEPFLRFYGEDKIDYAFVSHGDEDHISVIRELLTDGYVEHLVMTELAREDDACQELAALAASEGVPVSYIQEGKTWNDGSWQFQCLFPDQGQQDAEANDQSMVLKLETEDLNFLFTGDITADSEMLLDPSLISDTDVLKVAHHGSRYSSCSQFLEETGARIAVVSAGKGNRYGHPTQEALDRLADAGMHIFCTIDDGAVTFICRHGRFYIE